MAQQHATAVPDWRLEPPMGCPARCVAHLTHPDPTRTGLSATARWLSPGQWPPQKDLADIDDAAAQPDLSDDAIGHSAWPDTASALVRSAPMGEHDPLVRELLKCQQAEALMNEEFTASFEALLAREQSEEESVKSRGRSSLRTQQQ